MVESLYIEIGMLNYKWQVLQGKIIEFNITYLKIISLQDNTFLSWKSKEILEINFCGNYKF